MRTILLVTIAGVTLAGCGVQISQPSQSTANEAASKMTYTKDSRTGLCFGVVSSRSVNDANDKGMTITWVPCDEKVLQQIGK